MIDIVRLAGGGPSHAAEVNLQSNGVIAFSRPRAAAPGHGEVDGRCRQVQGVEEGVMEAMVSADRPSMAIQHFELFKLFQWLELGKKKKYFSWFTSMLLWIS